MAHIALNDAARAILREVKNLIANEPEIKEEKLGMGRVYGGVVLTKIDELKSELEIEGYKIVQCNIFHFLRGANVRNPTTRLLLIPIDGKATLSKGEHLVPVVIAQTVPPALEKKGLPALNSSHTYAARKVVYSSSTRSILERTGKSPILLSTSAECEVNKAAGILRFADCLALVPCVGPTTRSSRRITSTVSTKNAVAVITAKQCPNDRSGRHPQTSSHDKASEIPSNHFNSHTVRYYRRGYGPSYST